ncbi:MAG: MAPEG family protein [Methyloceanibacter sp.]|uniref:MAPEG family protein n=1 Tax=Methyloceanibacter sp. TaxID=1965321 RepID=UPI003D6D784B
MQRSVVEQRQTPGRRKSQRRHPRSTFLGFTPRQWPFIGVLVGNWLFAATFYVLAKIYWQWMPESWTVGERIELVIKVAVFALMPALLAICIVAAQRLDPSMWVGRAPKPNSALDINTHFILNTFEQSILFVIGLAGLALYCPIEEARTLIILAVLFLAGRVLFWVGYHYHPYVRAFGFGITFYPTVMVYVWLFFRMVFDVKIF